VASLTFDSQQEAQEAAQRLGGTVTEYNRGDPAEGRKVWTLEYDADPNEYADEGLEDWQEDLAGTPLLGWLSGADASLDRAMNAREQSLSRQAWEGLAETAPGEEDLSVDYRGEASRDEYGDLLGPENAVNGQSAGLDAQRAALRSLQGLVDSGGYTRADQAARNEAAMATGQRLRGANQAALQQAQARGMGGGGAEMAARLSGSQAQAMGNAQADSQIQQAAMMRALQAMQSQGALGGSLNSGELARQQAFNTFNQQNMDWRRQREGRNAAWANRGAESRSAAAQQAYENRERIAAGLTNQWQSSQGNRRADGARQDEANQAAASGIGSFIEAII
jgi:hypothetical protein